jgi:hypothetical protein
MELSALEQTTMVEAFVHPVYLVYFEKLNDKMKEGMFLLLTRSLIFLAVQPSLNV